jgi:Ca2+-binding EF-hand superfamily protein
MKSTRLLIAGAVAALLPFAGAVAQTPPPTPQESPPTEPAQKGTTFESLDANSDGKISKEEAAANQNVSSQFSRYDQNGNGYIEREEVGATNKSQEPAKQ